MFFTSFFLQFHKLPLTLQKMFRLDRHIEILLLKHDCVILPGFGGFVTHHINAQLDNADGMMLPPKTIVGFNQQLTVNDSLLVQSYVEAYDYSFPEALRVVEEEIEQMREMINEYGHFEIHSIGMLSINNNGNYEFEPTESGILVPKFYGLPGIDTTETDTFISRQEAKETKEIKENKSYSDDDNEYFIRISTRVIRRAAVACIAILLIITVPFISRNSNKHEMMSSIDNGLFTELLQQEIENNTAEPKQEVRKIHVVRKINATEINNIKSKEDVKPKEVETKESVDVSISHTPSFTVVLAARITEKNAKNYVDELHKQGKKLASVIGNGKSRKVIYGNYNSEEEAQQVKRQLAVEKEFASAWVTKIQ